MEPDSQDIVDMLERQRRFHQQQLRLIDIALAAIRAGRSPGAAAGPKSDVKAGKVKKHRIRWTREIDRFLDGYDEFTIMDIQNDLAEKRDIPSAMTIQGRNVISNTLNRFEKKGRIQKIRPGVFKVVKVSVSS